MALKVFALRLFHGTFTALSGLFQEAFRTLSGGFQEAFRTLSGLFQGSFRTHFQPAFPLYIARGYSAGFQLEYIFFTAVQIVFVCSSSYRSRFGPFRYSIPRCSRLRRQRRGVCEARARLGDAVVTVLDELPKMRSASVFVLMSCCPSIPTFPTCTALRVLAAKQWRGMPPSCAAPLQALRRGRRLSVEAWGDAVALYWVAYAEQLNLTPFCKGSVIAFPSRLQSRHLLKGASRA